MDKKVQAIRMYPEDAHKLKIWAAEANKPIGDLIHDILILVDHEFNNSGLKGKSQND